MYAAHQRYEAKLIDEPHSLSYLVRAKVVPLLTADAEKHLCGATRECVHLVQDSQEGANAHLTAEERGVVGLEAVSRSPPP